MLEVINGFLMLYFVILSSMSILVPQIIKPIVACLCKPSYDERLLLDEIIKLKNEQSGMSMKDEFAAYSKLQRQINKLEGQLKEDSQSRLKKSITLKGSIHIAFKVIFTIIIFVSVIWFRHEPIVALKVNLFPFTTILRYPCDVPNSISAHVWVLISNLSIRTLLKPLTA